jgi:hypothetical protein
MFQLLSVRVVHEVVLLFREQVVIQALLVQSFRRAVVLVAMMNKTELMVVVVAVAVVVAQAIAQVALVF